MATLAELLRQGADKLVNLPSEAQRFITNPQAFTQLITGKNPLPRETGFAAGATGLPAQEMSVLDPNQAPYMQGYTQGEPIGYAGMAAPFAAPAAVATAKALAPKAGQIAENYMVKQGMIQPLTAYHGTPNLFDKFDKSKIGTGSGNDFGYGAYFAELPETAKGYTVLPNKSERIRLGDKVVETNSIEGQLLNDIYSLGRKAAIKKYPDQADYIKTINPNDMEFEGGNLLKTDIPDNYIPKMINWSSSEQSEEVSKLLKKAGLPTNIRGEDIYFAAIEKAGSSDAQKSGFQKASEYLNSIGIRGITYPQRSYDTDAISKNYVVFDPTDVKILERNNQPISRKELIQEQIDKIE
jgi:hypothetical protein